MSRTNGRLEPEVIVNVRLNSQWKKENKLFNTYLTTPLILKSPLQYGDGFAYSKYKLEEAFRTGGLLDKPTTKPLAAAGKSDPSLKKEDIDIIVRFLSY